MIQAAVLATESRFDDAYRSARVVLGDEVRPPGGCSPA